ncbi:glycosyltransferase family 39 protein [Patescibacteria group bacterium]|nr:glycosyltransferase family 39 protein [Patescibacteria group bacterium]
MINSLFNFIKKERVILIIILLTFLISLSYAFYFHIRPAVDASAYDQVAMNIVEGRGFRLNTNLPLLKDDVITYQGPFYQYFLAGIYLVFGHHYEAVWIIQSILRALSVLLIFLVCIKIFGRENRLAGWLAGGFLGFYPDLIEMGAMLMTETLFIFFLILVIYIFIHYYEKICFKGVFLLALSFGSAILVRSSIGLFLPVFIFYFCKHKAYKHLFLFLFLICIIMTPWAIRNYSIYHEFLPTMANFGFNLWVGNHERGDGEGGNMPELFQAIEQYGPIEANHYAAGQFKNFVIEHPLAYVKLTATRIIKYFSFIRPMGFWFYQHGWSQFIFIISSAFASVLLFTFGFAGIFAALKKEKNNAKLIYLIIFAFLTCLSVVFFLIETRYRLPIYPFMAVFAGFFIARLIAFKKEYLKYLIISSSALFLLSLINFLIEYDKIIEKLNIIFYGK